MRALRLATILCLVALVLTSSVALWLVSERLDALATAADERAQRAEERTDRVVEQILGEMREPLGDTRRDALFLRAERIESKVDDVLDRLDP